jgi:hypothetical protein
VGYLSMRLQRLHNSTDFARAVCLALSTLPIYGWADAPISGAQLNTPESPASTIVGASTQGITHPGTAAEAGLSLLNGLDANGNLKTGVGIEASPVLLAMPYLSSDSWITADSYKANPEGFSWTRLAARTSLSIATAKGANTIDQSVAVAAGLRTTIFDMSDIALDQIARDCIIGAENDSAALVQSMPPTELNTPFPSDDVVKAFVGARDAKCVKESKDRNWNRSSWNLSIADSYVSPDGTTNKLKQQTFAVNSTLAWGFDGFRQPCASLTVTRCANTIGGNRWFENHAQLVFGLQFQNGALVPDPKNKGQFFSQDAWQFGTQLRMKPWSQVAKDPSASSNRLSQTVISLEAVYISAFPEGMSHSNDFQVIASSELQLSDTLYLDFGFGVDRKQSTGKETALALTQFKWNFGSNPTL